MLVLVILCLLLNQKKRNIMEVELINSDGFSLGIYTDINLINKLKELVTQHDIYKRIAMFEDTKFYTPKVGRITGTIIDKGLSDE